MHSKIVYCMLPCVFTITCDLTHSTEHCGSCRLKQSPLRCKYCSMSLKKKSSHILTADNMQHMRDH